MNNNNVATVRNAYAVAERKDLEGWINLFTPDGVFVDNSVGATYRGRALADPVRNYGTAFSNMHRELYRIYADGNVVIVQLALQGPTMARCNFLLASSLPRVSKWMPRAATCSNSKTARSNASIATQRGQSSLLSSGS
jgi:SnoaL-like domain